jgi:hypothetical protein
MKKTIISLQLLALFMGLVFSNTVSAGLFSNFYLGDPYVCRIEYTQLYANTGAEKQKRVSKSFVDHYGCKSEYVSKDLVKKITDWLDESPNHIIEQTTWEGLECKIDNGSFGSLLWFLEDWGPYEPCSIEAAQSFIDTMAETNAAQISNKVKYPEDYPSKVAYD